jgi:hypothetical protein
MIPVIVFSATMIVLIIVTLHMSMRAQKEINKLDEKTDKIIGRLNTKSNESLDYVWNMKEIHNIFGQIQSQNQAIFVQLEALNKSAKKVVIADLNSELDLIKTQEGLSVNYFKKKYKQGDYEGAPTQDEAYKNMAYPDVTTRSEDNITFTFCGPHGDQKDKEY